MRSHYTKLIRIALIFGVIGFFVFAGLSLLAWRVYPYQPSDDDLMRQLRWTARMVGEKIGGLVLLSIMAFVAARVNRPTWKIGVSTAVVTAVVYQLIAVIVYLVRFGFSSYQTYHNLLSTLFYSIALAWLFGFFAVWKQYRDEKRAV
jgi:hypothetical protein